MTEPDSNPSADGATRTAGGSGHRQVDEVVASLDRLDSLPVTEHPAVFDRAQARLRAVLDETPDGPADPDRASAAGDA